MNALPLNERQYTNLLGYIQTVRAQTEMKTVQAVNRIVISGYWQIGRRLCEDELLEGSGRKVILNRLAEDLKLEYTFLTRVMKFHRLWPELCPAEQFPQVSWSHYKKLLSVQDSDARQFYLETINEQRWNIRLLTQRIKDDYYTTQQAGEEAEPTARRDDEVSGPILRKRTERLFLYSAYLEKVIDGDTLMLNIDLGFDVWKRLRIRLRGIDTAELGTPEGDAAKEFVQNRLRGVIRLVIQTFKVDMYGRYVCDVFYRIGETDKEVIVNRGSFLNQELLDAGLASVM